MSGMEAIVVGCVMPVAVIVLIILHHPFSRLNDIGIYTPLPAWQALVSPLSVLFRR